MGLAPIIVDKLYNHVMRLAAEGITVVVVRQFARTHGAVGCNLGHGDGERTDHPDRGDTRRGVGAPVGLSGDPLKPTAARSGAQNGTTDRPTLVRAHRRKGPWIAETISSV